MSDQENIMHSNIMIDRFHDILTQGDFWICFDVIVQADNSRNVITH